MMSSCVNYKYFFQSNCNFYFPHQPTGTDPPSLPRSILLSSLRVLRKCQKKTHFFERTSAKFYILYAMIFIAYCFCCMCGYLRVIIT